MVEIHVTRHLSTVKCQLNNTMHLISGCVCVTHPDSIAASVGQYNPLVPHPFAAKWPWTVYCLLLKQKGHGVANTRWCNKPLTTMTCISSPYMGRSTTYALGRRLVVGFCSQPPSRMQPGFDLPRHHGRRWILSVQVRDQVQGQQLVQMGTCSIWTVQLQTTDQETQCTSSLTHAS